MKRPRDGSLGRPRHLRLRPSEGKRGAVSRRLAAGRIHARVSAWPLAAPGARPSGWKGRMNLVNCRRNPGTKVRFGRKQDHQCDLHSRYLFRQLHRIRRKRMVREPWFERRGLFSRRVISPKGWILQLVTTAVFFGFGFACMYTDESHPVLSWIFATAAILSAGVGFFVMSRHTQERGWRE
jgi:hypothetical protein